MSRRFFNNDPVNLTNRIERVAVVGAGGQIGRHLVDALLKTRRHRITAISRAGGSDQLPDGLEAVCVNYHDQQSLVQILKGHEFLVIALAGSAPFEIEKNCIVAAGKAGVPFVMTNCFSIDFENQRLAEESCTANLVLPALRAVEETQVCAWIPMMCSFWYEYSVTKGQEWYGFDLKNRKVTFFDDGQTKVAASTWQQCGRALANLLSLKILPEDEHDEEPTVSDWKNRPLRIKSFLISQRDILDSINRVQGMTDKDWIIEHESSYDRWQRGLLELKSDDSTKRYLGFVTALYSRTFFPNGDGIITDDVTANTVLHLPEENLDVITEQALRSL
ncbi:unnamed protein product [Clonostachys rosea]|uniref:NAD(P)-binding domain-containing protein n=1 Tax=Bionectria ochroleuca TaxID=29856 RepID=A0ABY6U8P1_BIOOC|nr:unnamed protein product [Clonostachys rosea]